MKNNIAANISYLLNKSNCTQDEFGALFDLGRGTINQYIKEKSLPKIDTIQKICGHYKITIDDFVNLDLSLNNYTSTNNEKQRVLAEPPPDYGNAKYVKQLEDMVQLQKEFIEAQKLQIENLKTQPGAAS